MRADEIEKMRQLPLLDGVDPLMVDTMLRNAFLQRFPPHVELVAEGDRADFLHVVVEGQVEVYSTYRGRETVISVLGPGHSFIVAAVILDRIYLKSVRTLTQARVLLLPAEAVRNAFATDAMFARSMAREVATAYRGVVKELKNQKLRSGIERLSNWLLSQEATDGRSNVVQLPFDKRVLASRLGMAPEVLSRSFATLQAYGVTVSGTSISIGDRGALVKLARPSITFDDPVA